MLSPKPDRWQTAERAFLLALALLVAVFSLRAAYKAAEERSAFCRWRSQLLQLQDGVDISAKHAYPNPPIMAVLLEPLAFLPPIAGALAWYALKVLMAGLSVWWMFRLLEAGGVAMPPWARMLALSLALKPVLDDLSHGNVNILILFLVVGTFAAYQGRRDALAGVLLALAIACKVTPALLVPYFLYKRAWRVLLGVVAGGLLFFYPGFVPAARLGMNHNLTQLKSWYTVMVHPFVVEGKVTAEHINQSLPGLVHRLATRSPSFVTFPNDVETPARYDNLLDLPPAIARNLVKACLVLFAVVVVWTCRSSRRAGWQLSAELGIIVLGMLLFSERTWKHHAVTLLVPLCVLVYYLAAVPASRALKTGVAGVLAVSLLLTLLPGLGGSQEREEVWANPTFAKMSLVYGAYTAAFLLLTVTLVALLRLHRDGASMAAPIVPLADDRPTARAA